MTDCIFCRIAAEELPADIVYRDHHVVAFRDLHPVAPTHILIVPRRHVSSVNDFSPADAELVGRLTLAAQKLARERGFAEEGYRLTMNCNRAAGQTVFHVHMHLMAGRTFAWPPG